MMTKCSTWTALRNPVFRQLWFASVISGTCVAAHDGAAIWMMNKLTGSPFLISLMSTVASLSFFLFTLPAGVLADKVDRQKLVCAINLCLAATALGLAVLGWLHLLNPCLILSCVFLIGVGFAVPDEPASGGPAFRSAITQRFTIIANYCACHKSLFVRTPMRLPACIYSSLSSQ
jgi:MFS family permease